MERPWPWWHHMMSLGFLVILLQCKKAKEDLIWMLHMSMHWYLYFLYWSCTSIYWKWLLNFCETGSRQAWQNILYSEDPLWDGQGCGLTSSCCQFNSPPWFCKKLATSANYWRHRAQDVQRWGSFKWRHSFWGDWVVRTIVATLMSWVLLDDTFVGGL